MAESPIGQRLKFLISQLGHDVVSFSKAIGAGDTTVRNYYNRGSKPNADFFEKLTNTFESVNLNWLLSGKGEPFVPGSVAVTANTIEGKKNKGIQSTGGTNTINNISLDDCKRELEAVRRDAASYQREIELLKGQLDGKDALIAAKEEMLTFLRGSHNRPN